MRRLLRLFPLVSVVALACAPQMTTPPPTPGRNPDEGEPRAAPPESAAAETGNPTPTTATPSPDSVYAEAPEDIVDDAGEAGAVDEPQRPIAHPLDGWSEEQIEQALRDDPASLGPMSIGSPNGGRLVNGVRMPESDRWEIIGAPHVWGTQETIDALTHCIEQVNEQFPTGTHPLYIGHISSEHGGHLTPHRSHQAGRDVDVSYYYVGDHRWFAAANAKNLDRARTWAFVRALITETDVELILINASIQRLLREHAESIGEDPAWLDNVFRGGGGHRALIRHASGHGTHIHVRFFSPVARETARRAAPAMIELKLVEPPQVFVWYRARQGDTLGKLARRYGTTVQAIQRANGLRSTVIIAKKSYRIPQPGARAPQPGPISIPERRLPPPGTPAAQAASGG